MTVRFIAELGSCHMGKIERIVEAIHICKEFNMELKLQLFPNESPFVPTNIFLEDSVFKLAFNYAKNIGVILSASVFDQHSEQFLLSHSPKFIKYAFSQKDKVKSLEGIETIVSCDVMTDHLVPLGPTKLYCIPEYPVRYEVNFDELFPRFDGFSDHTLGLRQTRKAIEMGAKVIEKHVRLGYEDETCPDARFAVNIRELGKLASELNDKIGDKNEN